MKRYLLLSIHHATTKWSFAVLTSVVLLASALHAQSPFSIYAGGLVSIPSSPSGFQDYFKDGYHGMVGVGLKSFPSFQFVIKVEKHHFALDADKTPFSLRGNRNIWLYGVDGRLGVGLPASQLSVFILIGGGVANVATDLTLPGSSSSIPVPLREAASINQYRFYYNIGGGLQLKLMPAVSVFAQVRVVKIATSWETTALVPITLGLKLF